MISDQNEVPSKQGSANSGWLVLDYGSLIVHIMTPQLRNFYKLEKRWKESEMYDFKCFLSELNGLDYDGYEEKSINGWINESGKDDEDVISNEKDEDPFWR